MLHDSGVFGRTIHYRDVVRVVLDTLSAPALRELEAGVRRAREIPCTDGRRRTAAFIDTLNQPEIERKVSQLFRRNQSHLMRNGLDRLVRRALGAGLGPSMEQQRRSHEHEQSAVVDARRFSSRSSGWRGAAGDRASRLVSSRSIERPCTTDVWKASCASLGDHPAVSQLLEDPYSRDARLKPAGYAGDARTLDYVYLRDPGSQPVSRPSVARCSMSAPACRSPPPYGTDAERSPTRSCGAHGRSRLPSHRLRADTPANWIGFQAICARRICFWGIDQDAKSISHCRSRVEVGARHVRGRIGPRHPGWPCPDS